MNLLDTVDVKLLKHTADLLDLIVVMENRFDHLCRWDRTTFIDWLVCDYFKCVNDSG